MIDQIMHLKKAYDKNLLIQKETSLYRKIIDETIRSKPFSIQDETDRIAVTYI